MKKIVCVIVIFLSVSLFGCDSTNMTYTTTTTTHFTETSTMSTEVGCEVYPIPDIEISNSVVTTDSFSFDYEIILEGCQGFISKMYIYEYFEFHTVYTFEDYSETLVSGLESRTDYVLRIEYTFLDIDNDQTKFVKLYSFLTEPELSIDAVNQTSTSDSISFELDIVDPESVLYISSIDVYSLGLPTLSIPTYGPYVLTGLEPGTEYTVKVEYSYPIRYNEKYTGISETLVFNMTTEDVPSTGDGN